MERVQQELAFALDRAGRLPAVCRVRRLPALPLYCAGIAAVVIAGAIGGTAAAQIAGFVVPVLLVLYALVRTHRRGDVAGAVVMPSCVSSIAITIVPLPQWIVALPLMAISLALLAEVDRDDRRARAQRPGAVA
ncbi:hypothetical protein [Conexibacter sp. CPCC 206217]|uniref:hypothetical protein n=1 Tax=Conexibacter sp. CPCC 206217 TaxID=3064574 RepID=UPI00272255EA|nr:hypothetical protein [Conexibacter sp. CPCC 206217]MDO8210845.1 hypothetical protein [Conexibacter sp. CPCC 206217]